MNDRPYTLTPLHGSRWEARAFRNGRTWGDRYSDARIVVVDDDDSDSWIVEQRKKGAVLLVPVGMNCKAWRMTGDGYELYLIDRHQCGLEATLATGSRIAAGESQWPWEDVDDAVAELGFDSWWFSRVVKRRVKATKGVAGNVVD